MFCLLDFALKQVNTRHTCCCCDKQQVNKTTSVAAVHHLSEQPCSLTHLHNAGSQPSEPEGADRQEEALRPHQTEAYQLEQQQDGDTTMFEAEEDAAEHKSANPVTASRPPIRPNVVGIKKAHRMNISKFAPKELQK